MIPGHILTVAILAMFLFVWITTCPCFNPSIPSRTVRSRPWNLLCRPHCPHDRPARENGSYSTWLMQGSNSWYSGCTESTHVNWHWNIMKYLYSCNNDIQLIQPTILSTNVIWLVDFSEIQVVIAILDSPACSDAKVKKNDTKNQNKHGGMDQYLLIPFLGGWTSIYQLFWCSLGARVLTHPHMEVMWWPQKWSAILTLDSRKISWLIRWWRIILNCSNS